MIRNLIALVNRKGFSHCAFYLTPDLMTWDYYFPPGLALVSGSLRGDILVLLIRQG